MLASLTDLLKTLASHPGQAFRDLFPAVLIATLVLVVLHLVIVLLTRPASPVPRVPWSWWERLVYLLMVVAIADLAVTAFYSVYRYDTMGGWALFAHMGGSGALILALPLVALTWAEANRPECRTPAEPRAGETLGAHTDTTNGRRFFWLTKLTFWIILASGLVTASTMLVSMLHWYDTAGLERMLDIHRYSGLLLVVATIFHVYGVGLRRLGLR